jgi:polar amino acid transport system substrate-binding protein
VSARGRRASSAAAKVAAVLAAALMVTACAGAVTTVRGAAVRPVDAAAADASLATAASTQPSTCNPKASSLRPAAGPPSASAGPSVAKIRLRGYLIAGVDQSTYHFGFLNPLDGQIEGFDIDMIHAVAKAIFGDPNKVVFKAITDSDRINDVENGTVDIVAHTMTITCARLQQVDFSSVYFDAAQRVLVLKDNPATSLGALKGQKVCATSGSDSLTVIKNAGAIPVAKAYWTDCLVQLQQDDVAGISTDDAILYGLAAQDPFTKVIGPRLTDEPYGLAISKKNPDLVRFVNAVLAQLRANGSWAASYAHWVGTPVPAPPAAQYSS